MSHIHLPDGVLPFVWWFTADLLAIGWLLLVERRVRGRSLRRQLPLPGAMGALMLLTMSVPLGPLPFHLNLTVLTGMIAGPWLGFITVFVVNAMLSLLGHGGLTVIGLNSLIMGVEVVLGWWLFHRLLRPWPISVRAVFTPILTLLVSITLSLSMIGWSTGLWTATLPHAHEDHLLSQQPISQPASGHAFPVDDTLRTAVSNWQLWGMKGLWALGVLLSVGLLTESLATLAITRYLLQVRPDLLDQAP